MIGIFLSGCLAVAASVWLGVREETEALMLAGTPWPRKSRLLKPRLLDEPRLVNSGRWTKCFRPEISN